MEIRNIIIGKNSKVWKWLKSIDSELNDSSYIAISNIDIENFDFKESDLVWIFSYSIKTEGNRKLINRLSTTKAKKFVYVTSATTVILDKIKCYKYPKVKYEAEVLAQKKLGAKKLSIGIVYQNTTDLPSGINIVTKIEDIAQFIKHPVWDTNDANYLFTSYEQPFKSKLEKVCYNIYNNLMTIFSKNPCILRPIDLLLKIAGYNWYGYVYKSNKKWNSMK